MRKTIKRNNDFQDEKIQKLKLKISKDNSNSISISSSKSSSNSPNKIGKSSRGITVNNRTVIYNTRYELSGSFNKKLDGIASNKDIGQRAKAAIKYQDRETNLDQEQDKDLTHSYDLEKQLSKEDMKEINDKLDKGVPALRTSVLSINQDKNLSDREELAIVQKAIAEHNSKYNKNLSTVITQHNDTKNRHYHITQFGSKDDIKSTDLQIEDFKIRVATLTKNELDNKGITHNLDKEINNLLDKQEKVLQIESKLENLQDKLSELEKERVASIDKATDKIVEKLDLTKDQADSIKAYEKANGYKQFLEKQENPDPVKLQKAEQWKQDTYNKLDDITKDKHTQLKVEVDKFNESKEFKEINQKFIDSAKQEMNKTSQSLKNLSQDYKSSFFHKGDDKHADILEKHSVKLAHKADNLDNKKFKNISLDSVLNKADSNDRESLNELTNDLKKDIKSLSKNVSAELNSAYNKEKGGLFLEHDKVSKKDANEIEELKKDLDKRSSGKDMEQISNSFQIEAKLVKAIEERQKHSKNQNSKEFRDAQTQFFNVQAVKRDGVDLNEIEKYTNYAIKNGRMTEENAERFKANAETHANELKKAGILKSNGDNSFSFTDDKSREILYDNHNKSIKEISSLNKENLKQVQKEVNVYKKTQSSKDLKKVQKEIKQAKDRKQNRDFKPDFSKK